MAARLTPALVQLIEDTFMATHAAAGTEDRMLIYRNEAGQVRLERPEMERRRGMVKGDVDLTREIEGRFWDLAFDLHSHHEFAVDWSKTDDANERIRGVTFGVFSWAGGQPLWLFRRFDGSGFVDLTYGEVVGSG